MNIIFITIAYPRSSEDSNLYSDLMEEFAGHGHKVVVVSAIEKRYGTESNLSESNGIKVLRVQTGNITSNPNYIAKGLALLRFQSQFIRAVKQYFPAEPFDLILYSTPPVLYNRIIRHLKRKSHALTYLLLKDIFPQNALDIGLLSKWNPVVWYFRIMEKETYRLSDHIGCMSPANVRYLRQHNPSLPAEKVEVCANSLKDRGTLDEQTRTALRTEIRQAYRIKEDELCCIYGGNLGIAQGLGFLLEILGAWRHDLRVKFFIIGDGTWFNRLEKFVRDGNYANVNLQKRVSSEEYKKIMIASDIGLIFLNPKFTIPNFPSRLTSCLEIGLPVIACTDSVSDAGDVVMEAGCGYKVISGDIKGFNETVNFFLQSPGMLQEKSANARALFEKSYTTEKSYDTIMKHLKH